jgi:uncharacterized protein involved in exopolysaccharide biosynthesis
VRPNRPKVAGVAVIVALLAGAGLAFAAEVTDQSIRRGSDVLGVIEGELIVSIPYIVTAAELRRRRRRIILLALAAIVLLIGLLTLAYFLLPPIDLIIAKARVGLFK